MSKKLKKRADGRYQTSFVFEGKRYHVYASRSSDLSDAITRKKEELKRNKINHDNPVLDSYYKDFTKLRRSSIKESTIRTQTMQYEACANVKIHGIRFGSLRIRDITPKDVQLVQQGLIESKRSSETVNNYMDHLSHVFNAAVRDETIYRNPCKCIEHVRRTEPRAADTKHRGLSVDETKTFLEAAEGSFYLNNFKLMLLTGMRVGEVSALTASDFDFRNSCIHVCKTVTRNDIGGYEIGDSTKTYSGKRDIPLTDPIRQIVSVQKVLVRDLFGIRFDRLLFPSPEGKILREYQINREIKRITTAAGIDHFTCHAFRATFATRWMEQRPQDFKVLSEILGHADTKITLNLYTHVMKETKSEAMNAIQISV